MQLVLAALLWLLGLLVVLLLLLLFLPVDMSVRLDSDLLCEEPGGPLAGAVRWQLRLRWGWGLFLTSLAGRWLSVEHGEVRLLGIRFWRPGRKEEAKEERVGAKEDRVRAKEAHRPRAKPRRSRRRLPLPVVRALIEEGLRLLARIWRDLGLQVKGDVTYGWGDPALTGISEIFLRAGPLPADLQVQPDWLDPRLEGWVQVKGRVFLVQLLIAGLAVLKNPVLRRHLGKGLKAKLRFRKIFAGGRVS